MNTKQQKRMLKDEGENKSVGFGNFFFLQGGGGCLKSGDKFIFLSQARQEHPRNA